MQIKRVILLVLTGLMMQSCASSIDMQRLQSGKVSFISGDFKSAFHQLLPLAAEGIPQAEYGVGYMYYYGYGVTQDTESGVFWMNKAASAHYVPAIRALAAIQENTAKEKENHEMAPAPINTTQAENTPLRKDVVLDALNNATLSSPQGHVTLLPQNNSSAFTKAELPAPKIKDNLAIASSINSHPRKYTLQLLGSYYLSSLKARQAQLNLGMPTYIGQTKHNGRNWYVLTLGQYPALSHAELAKLDLPKKIKDFNPWIRKCDTLTWLD